MNQKQRILASNAPIHNIGTARYKGHQPVYRMPQHSMGGYVKMAPGIPFVRIAKDYS